MTANRDLAKDRLHGRRFSNRGIRKRAHIVSIAGKSCAKYGLPMASTTVRWQRDPESP